MTSPAYGMTEVREGVPNDRPNRRPHEAGEQTESAGAVERGSRIGRRTYVLPR